MWGCPPSPRSGTRERTRPPRRIGIDRTAPEEEGDEDQGRDGGNRRGARMPGRGAWGRRPGVASAGRGQRHLGGRQSLSVLRAPRRAQHRRPAVVPNRSGRGIDSAARPVRDPRRGLQRLDDWPVGRRRHARADRTPRQRDAARGCTAGVTAYVAVSTVARVVPPLSIRRWLPPGPSFSVALPRSACPTDGRSMHTARSATVSSA